MALQIRRGTSSDVASASFVPAIGEPLYLTDNEKLYIGDGSTQGGKAIGGATDLAELSSVTLIDESIGALNLYQVTSNTVLVTLAVSQSAYYVGLEVVISNSSVPALNGSHTITAIPAASQFAFSLTTGDITSASVTGVVTPKIPNGNVLTWNDTNSYWENAAVLSSVASDTTPQLGGNLDTNNKAITSVGANNIEFDPATGQNVIFKGNTTNGSGRIKLNCENNSHGIIIKGPPHSAAANYTLTLPNDDGAANTYLKSDGSGNLSWDTASGISNIVEDTSPQLGGSLDINGNDIVSTSNGDIDFTPNGTGAVVFKGVTSNGGNGAGRFKLNCENNSHGITIQGPPHSAAANYTLTLPNDDGAANQVLETNGSGVLSWATPSASATGILMSSFEYEQGSVPASAVANTNILGKGFGSWYEANTTNDAAGNLVVYIVNNSAYNPSLTGITFNSTTGKFTGFPRGRYIIECKMVVKFNNPTPASSSTPPSLSHYLISSESAGGGAPDYSGFDSQRSLLLPYTSYGSAQALSVVRLNLHTILPNATGSNNEVYVGVDQNQYTAYYVEQATINFMKMGDI